MKRNIITLAIGLMLSVGLVANTAVDYRIIPLPQQIEHKQGRDFVLNSKTVICYPRGNTALESNANLLKEYIAKSTGLSLEIRTKTAKANVIILADALDNDNKEAYTLTVDKDRILIDGASAAGNFYGIAALRKAIPPMQTDAVTLPPVKIADAPRFGYRGMHFDSARHFFAPDSIKEIVDILALHNINRFHWHLTDDQGWRVEIQKYPLLTQIGSYRSGTCIGHDFETSDSIRYGGYYTREQIRDIINYAAKRHITIIPEIDLPGHMIAALTAYPHLGCTGGPYDVWHRWGVSEDLLCAGNDSVYTFLDDVLNEVMDLFPSEYIHLGGDECPKERWAACPKCQARITELGLEKDAHSTAEQKLQTYVMERAANTLKKRGRKMIGWDEIMEGGMFPGTTVMSWRGTEAAADAARQGHDAILTPTNYCYIDYAQSQDPGREPLGIGGFVPVWKVYSLEPVAEGLDANQSAHILGAQVNLWTEYVASMPHAEYMILPRLAAISEVQWTERNKKDYRDFSSRLPRLMDIYENMGYNYAKHVYDVDGVIEADPNGHAMLAKFHSIDGAPIYYTLDGTIPTSNSHCYTEPVRLTETGSVKAIIIRPLPLGPSPVWSDSVAFSISTGQPVELKSAPHSRYVSNGPALLTDGRFGGDTFNTGEWMGFEGTDLDATIDLGAEQTVQGVDVNLLVNTPNWIFDALGLEVLTSTDGNEFSRAYLQELPQSTDHSISISNHHLDFTPRQARYVRLIAKCEKSIPAYHGVGEGKPGFLFVDEIVVR